MNERAISLRAVRAALTVGIACAASGGLPAMASAQDAIRYGVNRVTIEWPEPNEPYIFGYALYVSRNGGPERGLGFFDQPRAVLSGNDGDTVVARVRTVGSTEPGGPLVLSDFSPPSPQVRFASAQTLPSASGFFGLHCAPCSAFELRAASNRGVPLRHEALPAPWGLVDFGDLTSAASLDQIWQRPDTGLIAVIPAGQGPQHVTHFATPPPNLLAISLAEIDDDPTRELLVRDMETGSVQLWEESADELVPVASLGSDPAWKLASAADLDGDGHSELWWQTGRAGELEIWHWSTAPGDWRAGTISRVATGAEGDIVEVADFDGDGRPEPLWRRADGQLTISYLWIEGEQPRLDRNAVLPYLAGDDRLEVRGSASLIDDPGRQILVQNRETYRVSAIFPAYESHSIRFTFFDLSEPLELVLTR